MTKFELPTYIRQIFKTFKENNFEIYLVGGSVRNLISKREVKNWDFTTSARPEQIKNLFKNSFYNNEFGTVGIPTNENDVVEVTTFRSERGYKDYRHPEKVFWGKSLSEDLSRRDFTINALTYDENEIIDLYEGQKDLKNKIIKSVGNASQRFQEDALRMMRAIRLAGELGFTIEEETYTAIKKNAILIRLISTERKRDELIRIINSDYASDAIILLKNSGLMHEIFPELEACFGVAQQSPQRHHIYDVGTHLVMSLKYSKSKDPIVRLATLIHDIGKPQTFNKMDNGVITFYNHEIISTSIARNLATRLKLSKEEKDKLIKLVRWHQFSVDERQTDKAIRRFIRRVGKEYLNDILDLRIADRLGGGALETSWRLELFKRRLEEVQKQPFTVTDLKVDGYDVMKILNIKPGPQVGQILNTLFSEVEKDITKNDREYLLKRIKEIT